MSTTFRITLLAVLCAAASACQPAGDDAGSTTPPAPSGAVAPGAPATDLAGAFACDDGSSVRLEWGTDDVVVTWPDGRTATLPRAESASGADGDAYVGDTVSVEHSGDRVVLRDGDKPALTCTARDGSAAAAGGDAIVTMRYACEPDTRVTVFSDDSARVALPDGQAVTMRRIANSEPPTFTGGSLYFAIGEADARLSQGDEANELVCTPA